MGEKLEIQSPWSGKELVEIEINSYGNNKRIYIGLNSEYDGVMEPYGDLTVNIDAPCPDYSGYLDTNNNPDLERFVVENNLGEFTGFRDRVVFVLTRFIRLMWSVFASCVPMV